MSKPTPGPWKWSDAYPGADGAPLRTLVHSETFLEGILATDMDHAPNDANARLIAAAPDLLEALLNLRDVVREFVPNVCGDELTAAEAAIAKARGK